MNFWDQILWWWRRPRPAPKPSPPTKPPPPVGKTPPPQSGSAAWLDQLLALHNQARAGAGLQPYKLHSQLEACAIRYAGIMAAKGQMSHSVDGTSVGGRIAAYGYAWQRAGENIAAGQTSPEAVTQAWMNSAGHQQNILGPYRHAGFGYTRSGSGAIYWCAVFAVPTGAQLLDQAIIVVGFDTEAVWEPPGLDALTENLTDSSPPPQSL